MYDGNKILMELNQDNEPVAIYLHGPGIDNPIGMLRDHDGDGEFEENEVFVFTKDHLNSVRDISNLNQKLIQRYNYSAYGKVKLERIADASDVRFVENYFTYTSREWEPEVGFICHRARCQDPNSGRWLSEDPIGFDGDDTNLYRYVKNSPINHNDPSGTGPILGGICYAADLANGIAEGVTGAINATNEANLYAQQVKDLTKDEQNCGNSSRKSQISAKKQLAVANQQVAEAKITNSLFGAFGGTVAGALVCKGLSALPGF